MNFNSKVDVTEVLLKQVQINGESIWEQFESIFDGEQENYLDFLVKNNYISAEQKNNWLKVYQEVYNGEDSCSEYDNIEAITYTSPDEFPYDVFEFYDLEQDDDVSPLNVTKAKEMNLINVPIFIETSDVEEYNEIYWGTVVPIIAHYMFENPEKYQDTLREI